MDFDLLLYIVLIIGSIAISVIKTLKNDEAERTAQKNRKGPISVETTARTKTASPLQKKSKEKTAPKPETQESEYFSYETISDRDFAKEFEQMAEETAAAAPATAQPAAHLNMDEESVFNGVVWSEILRRKYQLAVSCWLLAIGC